MKLPISVEREVDGRWIAEVEALPGALAYGATRDEAVAKVQDLVRQVIADRVEHEDTISRAAYEALRSGIESGKKSEPVSLGSFAEYAEDDEI